MEYVTERGEWEGAVLRLGRPHILQSWAWGESKAQTGWRPRRLLWRDGERPVAAASLLVRRLGPTRLRLPVAVAYTPRGPLLDWSDGRLRSQVLAAIEAEARRAGAIFVKIDPEVEGGAPGPTGQAVVGELGRRGWRPSAEQIQYRNTVLNDLRPDEEAMLAAMKPKWRYNIRLAERKGVSVRDGTPADLPTFYRMYVDTGERDGFLVRPFDYYVNIWQPFMREGLAHLLLAETPHDAGAGPDAVAGLILFRYGPTAWYFYGASTAQGRALMPNYALQWEAMRRMKATGCTRYDWWGAPDRLAEDDPMWGVYRFKAGFGGEFVEGIGAYDYVCNPSLYWLYAVAMPRLLELARRRHRAGASVTDGGRRTDDE